MQEWNNQLGSRHYYEFGQFRLDPGERRLFREGDAVPLTAKVFDILLFFVENSGRMLEKEMVMQQIWPDSIVEEGNLTRNVSTLRKALGDSPDDPRYIVTVSGRGYRFIANVKQVRAAEPALIVEEHLQSRVLIEQINEPITVTTASVITHQQPVNSTIQLGRWRKTWLLIAVPLMATLMVAVFFLAKPARKMPPQPTPQVKSLAVLPFKSLAIESPSRDKQDFLKVGMADVLITRLSNLNQLVVRPTSSVLQFAENGSATEKDVLTAGRTLGVDSILDGSIQQIGDRVRVTVRLVRVSDGQPLWSFKCDEVCTDVFNLQDTVSEKVTEALALKLSGDERARLNRRYTVNTEAYQAYLKGRYFTLQPSPESYPKALDNFQQAIAYDPNYALAWAGLADAHTTASENLLPPREAMPKAIDAARHALALDDTLGEAHAALGHALFHTWHFHQAEAELKRALELNPNSIPTYLWYGEFYAFTDPPKGIELLQRAQQLDPVSAVLPSVLAFVAESADQPDLAISAARKAYDLNPGALEVLVQAFLATGRNFQEAKALLKQDIARERNSDNLSFLAILDARTGKRAEALQLLDELKSLGKKHYVSPYYLAQIYASLGERDETFNWLEQAYVDQSEYLGGLKYDPFFSQISSDPRFADLLRRVRLE